MQPGQPMNTLSPGGWEHPLVFGVIDNADLVALSRFFHAMEQRSVAEQSSQSRQRIGPCWYRKFPIYLLRKEQIAASERYVESLKFAPKTASRDLQIVVHLHTELSVEALYQL